MKSICIMICASICVLGFNACGSKKPVGNFQNVECHTICKAKECTQQCISVSGDYYKK